MARTLVVVNIIKVIKEYWEEEPSNSKNEIQNVLELRAKLQALGHLTQENLLQAQERQSHVYNRGTQLCTFSPGDKCLFYTPHLTPYCSPSGRALLKSHREQKKFTVRLLGSADLGHFRYTRSIPLNHGRRRFSLPSCRSVLR